MDIQKVNIKKPLILSKEELMEIANNIIKEKINWKYEKSKGYWLITISPDGEIILPDKSILGHPDMAEKMIYPNDKILCALYKYLYEEIISPEEDNKIIMSFFMIIYGYINIDGYINNSFSTIDCRYNPLTLTTNTISIPDRMKDYANMYSTMDPKESDIYGIKLSKKVQFFKKRIWSLLESYRLEKKRFS